MPKFRRSKRANNHIHARRRAMERYGIELSQELHQSIVKAIRADKQKRTRWAKWQQKITNTRSLWLVEVEGQRLTVIYDKAQKSLVTVLPPDGELEQAGC